MPATLGTTPYKVFILGAENKDFQADPAQLATQCVAGHSYNAGDICTVNVVFKPTAPGLRRGAVQLMDGAGYPLASANIYGTGTGPLVTFPPLTNSFPNNASILTSNFRDPEGIAIDGNGNVYVTDQAGGVVKKIVAVNGSINSNSQLVTLPGGTNICPDAVAVDGSGNVFVTDYCGNNVYEVVAVNGSVSASSAVITIADGFLKPYGIAIDGAGNIFVTNFGGSEVYEIAAVNGSISPAAPVIISNDFSHPAGIAVDSDGNLFVADTGSQILKEIVAPASPAPTVIEQVGDWFPYDVFGIAVDSSGTIFVAERGGYRVSQITPVAGADPSTWPVSELLPQKNEFNYPWGLAIDGQDNIFVASNKDFAVKMVPLATPPKLDFGQMPIGGTSNPQTVIIANNGNAPLTFVVPSAGNNPSVSPQDFALDAGTSCPQLTSSSSAKTLAPATNCTDSISFTPIAKGPVSGKVIHTDDALNVPGAQQVIPLTGEGIGADVDINAGNPSIPYTGGQISATITYTGGIPTGAVTFTVGSNTYAATCSAAAGIRTCTISIPAFALKVGTYAFTVVEAADDIYAEGSGSGTLTVIQAVPVITWNSPAPISYGTALSSTQLNATASVPGNFAYNPAAGTLFNAGTYPLTVTFTPTDNQNYATATSQTSLRVTQAPTTTTLTASAMTVSQAGVLTLTARVASPTAKNIVPTGNVTFYDGQTLLGTFPLTNGIATYSNASLALGAHTISAYYSGPDTGANNFAPSNNNLSINIVAATDFTVTGSTDRTTINKGDTGTYTFQVSPVGPLYPGVVTFDWSGPLRTAGATATFSQVSLAQDAGSQSITVTIKMPATFSASREPFALGRKGSWIVLGLILLPFTAASRMRRSGRNLLLTLLLLIGSALVTTSLSGCGSGSYPAYSATLTATSGGIQRSTNVFVITN